jgi:hypothetical protein
MAQLKLEDILANKYDNPVDAQGLQKFADKELSGENIRFLLELAKLKTARRWDHLVHRGNCIVSRRARMYGSLCVRH